MSWGAAEPFVARGLQVVFKQRLALGVGLGAFLLFASMFGAIVHDKPLSQWAAWALVVWPALAASGLATMIASWWRNRWAYGSGEVSIEPGAVVLRRGGLVRRVATASITAVVDRPSDRLELGVGAASIALQFASTADRARFRAALASAGTAPVEHHVLHDLGTRVARGIAGVAAGFVTATPVAILAGVATRHLVEGLALRGPITAAAIALAIAAVTALGGLLGTRSFASVRIGPDGLVVSPGRWRAQRFVSYADLKDARLRDVVVAGASRVLPRTRREQALELELNDGTLVDVGTASFERGLGGVVARIRDRLEAWQTQARARVAVGQLHAGERDVATWLAELRQRAKVDDAYRDAGMPFDRVTDAVNDPSTPDDERLGAAVALASRGRPEDKVCVRIAAESTVNPRLRIALDSIARDVDARAVEESVAAALEASATARRRVAS